MPSESIILGAWIIKVLESQDLAEAKQFGEFDPWPHMTITLAPDLKPLEWSATLLHELLHAIDYQHGLGLSESKVRSLEQGLSAFCASNPRLAAKVFLSLAQAHDDDGPICPPAEPF